jgi:flagellar basal-body rod modification protein FlgD
MVDSVSSSQSSQAAQNALSQATAQDQSLDKTAFLKLLVEQMKNQDPLKPMDNTEFVSQLAQFSNLEQVMGINTRLDQLSLQSQGMQNTQISQMVGDSVTVNGSNVTLGTDGTGGTIAFSLDATSTKTTATISDSEGNVVRHIDLGGKNAGLNKVIWDGKGDTGENEPSGTYKVTVAATASNGAPMQVTQNTTSNVKSISFEKGYPELQLDNGLSVPVSELLRVNATTTTNTTTTTP